VNEPTLRAVTESGATWDDPSEDLLHELLSDLERGEESFFAVRRLGVAEVYMQVLFQDDRQYLVEHRDGGASSHFEATSSNKRVVHEVLFKWAFELPGWRELLDWTPVIF
jgi:hypothetical protein